MVNRVHVWVVSNGGPPKLSLPKASKMLRPGLGKRYVSLYLGAFAEQITSP